jgi:hypothetical protein
MQQRSIAKRLRLGTVALVSALSLCGPALLLTNAAADDAAEKTYLQVVIVRKRGNCTIAELVHFGPVRTSNKQRTLRELSKEMGEAYPYGNGKPYQDSPTIKLVDEGNVAIVTRGKVDNRPWNCTSEVMGVWSAKTYEAAMTQAEANARDWKVQGMTVIKRWPLPTVGD